MYTDTITQPWNTFASYGYEIWSEKSDKIYGRVAGPLVSSWIGVSQIFAFIYIYIYTLLDFCDYMCTYWFIQGDKRTQLVHRLGNFILQFQMACGQPGLPGDHALLHVAAQDNRRGFGNVNRLISEGTPSVVWRGLPAVNFSRVAAPLLLVQVK